ncbi:MAG: RluA family pseudouridine synthase [Clostridia bacterium]|nr:RluA family pseudouridine synthase [Clostridia bacterium]
MRTLTFEIPSDHTSTKVLHFLRGRAGLSSRLIRNLKTRPDGILCNGEPIRTIDYVYPGDLLTVNLPDDVPVVDEDLRPRRTGFHPSEPVPEPEILYEDEDLVAVNKPGGLAIHQSHNHQGDTLADWMTDRYRAQGTPAVFRAIGRLDKGTSGVVVCAKNQFAAPKLQGNVHKTYLALVLGEYEGSGTIDTPIYRPDPGKTIRACGPDGDPSVTHWESLEHGDGWSFLHITLETGRTHQIRVHFASLGTPLAGDDMYGAPEDPDLSRQALHCVCAETVQPYTGQPLRFEAPLPEDMERALARCRNAFAEPFGKNGVTP